MKKESKQMWIILVFLFFFIFLCYVSFMFNGTKRWSIMGFGILLDLAFLFGFYPYDKDSDRDKK